MKKYLIILFFSLLFFITPTLAQEDTANPLRLYFFHADGCPHCADEEEFLKGLESVYPNLNVLKFEVSKNTNNQKLIRQVSEKLNTTAGAVPFTVIGDQYISGFNSMTGEQIKYNVDYCSTYQCVDIVGDILGLPDPNNTPAEPPSPQNTTTPLIVEKPNGKTIPEIIDLPFLGEIKTTNLSLPILTIIIGAIDGFNPCAMWVLIFLISLLLGIDNKTRRWVLGGTFIFASGLVYFLFLAAWLNIFLFIGLIVWVRLLIGAVAIGVGGYNLRDYFVNKNAVCKVTGTEKRQKTFAKLKNVAQSKNFLISLGGIIIIAFAVNLVELVCSAGLPAIYTNILTMSGIPTWQYYGYLLLYILIFMLDDLIVFVIAMATMQVTGLSSKYSRYSNLIGGILMLILGAIMILKPELLMFG